MGIVSMKNQENEKWSVAEGEYDGMPLVIRLKTTLDKEITEGKYNYRVGIAIPLLHPTKNGLPTKEENDILLLMEDDIEALLLQNRGVLSSVVTTGNMKEFMMYVESDNIENLIGALKEKNPGYQIQYYVKEDGEWDGYKHLQSKFGI